MKYLLTLLIACPLLAGASAEATEQQPDAAAAAIKEARTLGALGGEATLPALLELLRSREETVRIAALRAIARVGLRSEKLADRVHEIVASKGGTHPEGVAGIAALGALGDGADMPLLLKLACRDTNSKEVRSASFRAMGTISSAKLPFVHARWKYWWRRQSKTKRPLLAKAILALEEDPQGESVPLFATAVERMAWLDVPLATAAIAHWLTGATPALRLIAVRLVGTLRLADFTERLTSIERRYRSTTVGLAATNSLKALGYIPPPKKD